jgi:hypothetical protein
MDDFISGKGCQIERHLTSLPGDEEKNPWKLSQKMKGWLKTFAHKFTQ